MELRDYQKEITVKGSQILNEFKILYLTMEVRTGKTLTALSIAQNCNLKNVLFLTRKKLLKILDKITIQ